jgi:hypothetical protein
MESIVSEEDPILEVDNLPDDALLYVKRHQTGVLHVVTKRRVRTWCNQFDKAELQQATHQDILLEICGACKRSLTGVLAKYDGGSGESEKKVLEASRG